MTECVRAYGESGIPQRWRRISRAERADLIKLKATHALESSLTATSKSGTNFEAIVINVEMRTCCKLGSR